MANLSITQKCNKSCVYCFAQDSESQQDHTEMSLNLFKQALEYLKLSDIKQVRILGGEPTLHSQFQEFIETALEQNFEILLFTNGLINNRILDFLANISDKKLSILLNTIHPSENNSIGMQRQQKTMKRLSSCITPGVNIYRSGMDLNYLVEYIENYNLFKEIRFGISHKMLSGKNVYLHPKEYYKVGYDIIELKLKLQNSEIKFNFDCGFVPCMFPEEYFELLSEELNATGTACHPIIDLLSNGVFISCYPLNNLKQIEMDDKINERQIVNEFNNEYDKYKNVGIFPHCSSCLIFGKRCNGGCLSFKIQRFKKEKMVDI